MSKLKKSFGKIYDKYIQKIYRFIFLKVSSQEIAEDLTSETFLKTWEVFKNQNPGSKIKNPSAFLYRIAWNLVIDHYRNKNKKQIVSNDFSQIVDTSNIEEKFCLNSEFEQIKKILTELKDDYQNVIIWRYIDGLSISEITKLLNKSEGATRVLLSRALKSVREKFDQKIKK